MYLIEKYTAGRADRWNDFIEESNNGTVFHRQDFLAYHPDGRFSRDDQMIYDGNRLVAVFPLSYRTGGRKKTGSSPYGASFGGLITKNAASSQLDEIAGSLFNALREEDYAELDVSFPPSCYYKSFNANIEYMLAKKFKVELVDKGLTSVVDLNSDRSLSQNFIRNLKKAQKNEIDVIVSKEVDPFYEILSKTIVDKHKGSLTHTLEELKYLKKNLPDMIKVFLGMHKGKAVSGVLVFENSSPCVVAFYNCHLSEFADLCPLHKVLDHITAYYKGRKRWLDLGLTDRFSSTYNWGLFQFKEGMGASSFSRNYYKFKLDE